MFGHDHLGLGNPHYKVKAAVEAHPKGWALGCFATTFGNPVPAVRQFLDSGKVPAFRLQAWWSYAHEIAPISFLEKELPRWEGLAKQYPNVKFYISHSCEYSNSNKQQIKKRVDAVRAICPSCEVVQTPMNSPVIDGYIVEEHGTKAKVGSNGIASTDGQALFDIDAEAWVNKNKNSIISFFWGPRYNLAEAHNTIPPKDRVASPDKRYIESLSRLAYPKGISPPKTFPWPVIELKKPLLWKTHGEDAPGEGDKRANRPLIILPDKTPYVEILTFDGQVLGRLIYFGGFPGNLHRFYSGYKNGIGLYGYEIADKAKAASGYEDVWIKQGKRVYKVGNPTFRVPFYQK